MIIISLLTESGKKVILTEKDMPVKITKVEGEEKKEYKMILTSKRNIQVI